MFSWELQENSCCDPRDLRMNMHLHFFVSLLMTPHSMMDAGFWSWRPLGLLAGP